MLSHYPKGDPLDEIDPFSETESIENWIGYLSFYFPANSQRCIEKGVEIIGSSDILGSESVPPVTIVGTRRLDQVECQWLTEIVDFFLIVTEIVFE